MAKLVACDLAQRDRLRLPCSSTARMGYMVESDVARAWRDLRLLPIAGGTSEIMKEIVSRSSGM